MDETENNSSTIEIIINELNLISRFAFLFINILYFVIIIPMKRTRKLIYFQIHHINFISLVQSILATSWTFSAYPEFHNDYLNEILCFISETLWGSLKYNKEYSILILAIHRYIAIFKPILYKKIVKKSLKYSLFSALFSWIISIFIFLISKYSSGSTYGFMCFDGNGSNTDIILLYFTISNTIGFIVPSLLVIMIYILISKKLNKNKIKQEFEMNSTSHQSELFEINQNRNEKILALQFFFINLLQIIAFFLMCIITITPIRLNDLGNIPLVFTCLEALMSLFVILIPITTMCFILKKD